MSATGILQPSGQDSLNFDQPELAAFADHMNLIKAYELYADKINEPDHELEELMQLFAKWTLLQSFDDLPLEIKWKIIDYAGINNIKDAISLAASSRHFRGAWNGRTNNLYRILSQHIPATILPAAWLAAESYHIDERMSRALDRGEDMAQLFQRILQQHNELEADPSSMTWQTASIIQILDRQVNTLATPFRVLVPGHQENNDLGMGLSLPISKTEMDRIKRAHFILEYLRNMQFSYSIVLIQIGTSSGNIGSDLQAALYTSFSETELRQVALLLLTIDHEIDNLLKKRLGIYQRRLCCSVPSTGICPSARRIAWELNLYDHMTLKDIDARNIPSRRIMKMFPFESYLGHDLKSLTKVYETNGMVHRTAQEETPSHPHRTAGIGPLYFQQMGVLRPRNMR